MLNTAERCLARSPNRFTRHDAFAGTNLGAP